MRNRSRPTATARIRLVLLIAGVLILLLLLSVPLMKFQEQSVEMDTIGLLTGLEFSEEANLLQAAYQPMPRGYLIAKISMPQEQLKGIERQPALSGLSWHPIAKVDVPPSTIEHVDWWRPSALQQAEVATYRRTADGQSRIVSIVVSQSTSADSPVYVWSMRD